MDAKRRSPWVWVAVAAMLLVMGYPLSYGPAGWLVVHGFLPTAWEPAYFAFYMPLDWLYSAGPEPLRSAFCWYADFCVGLLLVEPP